MHAKPKTGPDTPEFQAALKELKKLVKQIQRREDALDELFDERDRQIVALKEKFGIGHRALGEELEMSTENVTRIVRASREGQTAGKTGPFGRPRTKGSRSAVSRRKNS